MSRFERVWQISLVVFTILWSLFLVLRYLAGELRIEYIGPWVLGVACFLIFLRGYRRWMRERPRRVERQFVETHAIWAWHAIIFLLLTFVDAVMGYAILAGSKPLHIPTITMWTAYGAFVCLWVQYIAMMATTTIVIDAEGLWTPGGYIDWDDYERAKLNERLLNLDGKGLEKMYILLKPNEFIKAVETFKPKASDCEE